MSDMSSQQRPLPIPTHISEPHWKGADDGQLLVQRCESCSGYTFPPRPVCTHCFSTALKWTRSSGRGTIYSYTIAHRPPYPAFKPPYVVAIVELEEGWHMLTNLAESDLQTVRVNAPVEVFFESFGEITLPMFRLTGANPA